MRAIIPTAVDRVHPTGVQEDDAAGDERRVSIMEGVAARNLGVRKWCESSMGYGGEVNSPSVTF